MSLSDRIVNDQLKNAQLLLQNDRIGVASRPLAQKNVLTFKPVDEELLREYNQQFPKGFEYTDPQGNKVTRKYVPVGEAPDLDEIPSIANGELEKVYDEAGLNKLTGIAIANNKKKTQQEQMLRDLLAEEQRLDAQMNSGAVKDLILATAQKRDYVRRRKDLKAMIDVSNDNIKNAVDEINANEPKKIRNQGKIANVVEKNKSLIKNYGDLLNTVNRGAFNTQQQANETDDEYLLRLKRNAEIEAPKDAIEDMTVLTLKQFREKMREIVRIPSIIEQVANSIDEFGKVDNKLSLLKSWNLFKTKFVNVYGINNSKITADDIISFINFYLDNEDEDTPSYVKKEISTQSPTIISSGESKQLKGELVGNNDMFQLENLTDGKEVYFVCLLVGRNIHLLYSFTGNQGSFKEFFDVSKPKTRPEFSSDEIEKNTGISKQQLKTFFKITTDNFTPTSIIKKLQNDYGIILMNKDYTQADFLTTRNKKNIEYGYGLHSEKIPDQAQFGKIVILMKKLYYQNILAVKHHNGLSINGMPNAKVSEKFVRIVMNLLEGVYPTHSEINGLKMNEKELYDRLIYLADLHKIVPHNSEKTIHELKKRLQLLEGEKGAGNNSPLLKKDVKRTLQGLKGFGVISNKDMISHLAQF